MEQIKINDRLLTTIPFVRQNKRFADIGTDHAYLPIYLINRGIITNAIAADINKGPLDKAHENICKYNLHTARIGGCHLLLYGYHGRLVR